MHNWDLYLFVFLSSIFTNFILDSFVLNINFIDKNLTRDNSRYFYLVPEAKILGIILNLFCFYRLGFNLESIVLFLFFYTLLIVSCIDIKTMVIYNTSILFLFILMVTRITFLVDMDPLLRIIGLSFVVLPMALVNHFKDGSFGDGDLKLFAICGYLVGWPNIIVGFIIALVICSIYSIFLICCSKKKLHNRIAFAPFILIGAFVSYFYGDNIIKFYLPFF